MSSVSSFHWKAFSCMAHDYVIRNLYTVHDTYRAPWANKVHTIKFTLNWIKRHIFEIDVISNSRGKYDCNLKTDNFWLANWTNRKTTENLAWYAWCLTFILSYPNLSLACFFGENGPSQKLLFGKLDKLIEEISNLANFLLANWSNWDLWRQLKILNIVRFWQRCISAWFTWRKKNLVFETCNPIYSLLTFFFSQKMEILHSLNIRLFISQFGEIPEQRYSWIQFPLCKVGVGVTLDIFTVNIVQQQSIICLLVQSHIFRQDIGVALCTGEWQFRAHWSVLVWPSQSDNRCLLSVLDV